MRHDSLQSTDRFSSVPTTRLSVMRGTQVAHRLYERPLALSGGYTQSNCGGRFSYRAKKHASKICPGEIRVVRVGEREKEEEEREGGRVSLGPGELSGESGRGGEGGKKNEYRR